MFTLSTILDRVTKLHTEISALRLLVQIAHQTEINVRGLNDTTVLPVQTESCEKMADREVCYEIDLCSDHGLR